MAFVKPQINIIKPNIKNVSIYLRSVKKFGKSTLFRDVIMEKYGDPTYGLLVEVGMEHGANLLDNINTTHIESYKDLMELKKWLIEEKGREHNIKLIGIDVVDELIPMVEDYTIKLSRKETGKPCKTILEAYGGLNF